MSKPDLYACPVIAAVKNTEQLEAALRCESETIFLLFGDILNIGELTHRVRAAGKNVIVHIDLINGLSVREIAVDFIAKTTCADGIISTRPGLVRRARELGLFTVLRVFVIDSMALENLSRERMQAEPDALEILPGVMPEVLRQVCTQVTVPVIAGGLLSRKSDVMAALNAGAAAVSTTSECLWEA